MKKVPGNHSRHFFGGYLRSYFFLNFSIRPAVSNRRCLPVKNGWQLLQISILISARVDRVSKVLPQAQTTFEAV